MQSHQLLLRYYEPILDFLMDQLFEYKDHYYVELYIINKKLAGWVIAIKIDKNSTEPIDYCSSFFILT